MSLSIEPSTKFTFTVTREPKAEGPKKTLLRLMRMQPTIQRGLSRLAVRREREDNIVKRRGGRLWTSRAKVSKLVRVAKGETFTLRVTPQIIPDIQSVAAYLSATKA